MAGKKRFTENDQALLDLIEDDELISNKDLAARAGKSPGTTHHTLSKLIRFGLVERVPDDYINRVLFRKSPSA